MTSVGPSATNRKRAVAAGAIGNFVEWYDFIAYGALAVVIAPLFFPGGDPVVSLLATFAAFAVAFLFRPVGGFVFGYLGDRLGRRFSLSTAVLLMSASTAAVGLLPTTTSVGALGAVLLVLARCLQGMAAGGEWSGSAVYLVEFGDKRRRAFSASLTPTGAWLGSAGGVAVVALLNGALGPDAVADWAWRIPFLIAAPLGLVGFYLRSRLQDTPAFRQLESAEVVEKTPIRTALRAHKRPIFLIFVLTSAQAAATYALVAFMVSYMTSVLKVPIGTALLTNTIALLFAAAGTVAAGVIADRLGRRRVLLSSIAALVVLTVPLFLLIGGGGMVSLLVGQSIFGILIGGVLAPLAVYCVELFPANVRYASSAIGNSVGAGIIGGSSPLIGTALIAGTGLVLAPAYYIVALLLIAGVIAALMAPETVRLALDAEERTAVTELDALDVQGAGDDTKDRI